MAREIPAGNRDPAVCARERERESESATERERESVFFYGGSGLSAAVCVRDGQ